VRKPIEHESRRKERKKNLKELARLMLLPALGALLIWSFWGGLNPNRSAPQQRGSALDHDVTSKNVGTTNSKRSNPDKVEARHLPTLAPLQTPGGSTILELSEPPEEFYGRLKESGSDALYRDLLSDLGRTDAEYDPNLARAARELAFQYSLEGTHPPPDAVEFLVHASGAIDSNLSSRITRTSAQDTKVLEDALDRALRAHAPGDQTLRIGMGEIFVPGSSVDRYVGIVTSRRSATIDPITRQVRSGDSWTLAGFLDSRFTKLNARVLYPSSLLVDLPVDRSDETFAITVNTSPETGVYLVEISATGPSGPGKVIQVPLYVDTALPDTFETILPPDESDIQTVADAEARAFELLNADRDRANLPRLIWDRALRAIGRPHSEDMRDTRFFGHLSPNTGLVSDRIDAAGYVAQTYGENLAHHASLYSAQHALMRSLGHRINILNPNFTHVGTGIAIKGEGDERRWYLTQVFATPPTTVDLEATYEDLVERIQESRADLDLHPLKSDRLLKRAAQSVATRLANGDEDDSPRAALDEAEALGGLKGRSNASTALLSKPADF